MTRKIYALKDSRKKLPARTAGEIITDNLAPVLLSTAVISAMSYIYVRSYGVAVIAYTLMSFVLACFIFALYELLHRAGKTWLSVISVILLMLLSMGSSYLAEKPGEVLLWFMEPSRFTQIYYGRTASLVLMFGAILISCLYYFTRVRYRGVFVFLICLCPFCLFAKTFTDIPVLFPIIIMTLFFFIMAGNRGNSGDASAAGSAGINMSGRPIGRKGRVLAVTSFVIAVTVIASFFPKLSFSPFRKVFDEFVTGVTISAAEAAADFSGFSDSSSSMVSEESDRVVYYFYGDNPVLLKRQCFNYYDGKGQKWKYYGDSNTGTSGISKFMSYEDPTVFYKLTGHAEDEIIAGRCRVVPAEGETQAFYTPENIVDIIPGDDSVKIFRTENDEYFIKSEDVGKMLVYDLEWAEFDPDPDFSDMFTKIYAEELSYTLDDPYYIDSYLEAREQAVKYDNYLLSDEVLDVCYSSKARREEVHSLTERITSGYSGAYGKAKAIEQYLLGDGFVYDRDYTTPNGYPDYFILDSKRGACASYATAMVLMCREAGLTARYCEGFWVQKYDEDRGVWYVTSSDGHAFVQVWLDGYGWTDFNPTSPNSDGGYTDPTFLIVGGIALLLAAAGVIVMILRPIAAESSYVGKIRRARGTKQLRLIYGKMNRMLNAYLGNRENTFTPVETSEKIHGLFGYDVSGFTEKYENAVYGGIEPEEDVSEAQIYLGFREAYKNRIKQDKKEKKAKRK